jgi:UDP-glucose:(heptosyl)LPS alpha-1,3-glucosyltransferase
VKPLALAIIRQRYAADGGAERFVARTLEALKGEDVRLTLITREWHDVPGVEVIRVDPFYIGRLWRDWSFARAVCRLLRARKFDLVQSHERVACCDIYRAGDGVHREWLRQRARVLSRRGRLLQAVNPYHWYVKRAEKRVFTGPGLKAVICNSEMVKEEIKRYFGLPEERLHVIYNGVDLNEFHPGLKRHRAAVRAQYGIPDDATLFLFVGSGFERKGVPVLLDALSTLPPDTDTYLLIVGRDRKTAQYELRAKQLGLGHRVRFTGLQGDVKHYYGAADVFVLPTLYDPFPNVIPEALASNLPVITSDKSGAAELLRADDGVGRVCDALDKKCLADGMRSLSASTARRGLGEKPRSAVYRLDLAGMGARLVGLYRAARGESGSIGLPGGVRP